MSKQFFSIAILILLPYHFKIYECIQTPEHKYLDDFIYDLQEQSQNQSDTQCLKTFTRLLYGVKNHTLWATWIWDSMSVSPVGYLTGTKHQLGNYKQCLNPPWLKTHPEFRTKYCLVQVEPKGPYLAAKGTDNPVNPHIAISTFTHMQRNRFTDLSSIYWGLCLPESCDGEFAKMFTSILIKHNDFDDDFSDTSITLQQCHISDDKRQFPLAGYVLIMLFTVLTILAVASTYISSSKIKLNVTVKEIAHAFSLKENVAKLTRSYPEELDALNGIRFISASLIVIYHSSWAYTISPVQSPLDIEQTMKVRGPGLLVVFFMPFIVDAFFVMSGLLSVKLHMNGEMKWRTTLKLIIKRYFRLAPILAVSILTATFVLDHFASGPVTESSSDQIVKDCKNNWWLGLLMINNYVRSDEYCFSVSWTVPSDFHMSVVSIGLLYLYSRQRQVGIIAIALVFALSMILPAVTTYIYDLPPICPVILKPFMDLLQEPYFKLIYIKSHNRIGPYMVGLMLGYVKAIYKPSVHKKVISKPMSIIGTVVSFGLMYAVTLMSSLHIDGGYSHFEEILFAATYRSLFGIGFGLLIICLAYGTIPLINNFLAWKVFRPLGRLSYGIYLLHAVFMLRRYSSSLLLISIDAELLLVDSLGSLVMTIMCSFITWLLVEAPINHLCNYWLKPRALKDIGE